VLGKEESANRKVFDESVEKIHAMPQWVKYSYKLTETNNLEHSAVTKSTFPSFSSLPPFFFLLY